MLFLTCASNDPAHQRAEKTPDGFGKMIDLNHGQTADLSVFFPTDDGKLVPGPDVVPVPQFLGENCLSPFIDADQRLDTEATPFRVTGRTARCLFRIRFSHSSYHTMNIPAHAIGSAVSDCSSNK